MKVDLILVCEDPTFGVRGSRKFWAASFDIDECCPDHQSIQTRWGRVQPGREINVKWLSAQQHKSVNVDSVEAAIKFVDKKATEKMAKGYRVIVHEVDGVNIGQLHGSAADERGNFSMQTRNGLN